MSPRLSIGKPLVFLALSMLVGSTRANAVSNLKRFEEAPDFDLLRLDGTRVTRKSLQGQAAVIMFGELYNQNTISALQDLEKVFFKFAVKPEEISVYLIVTQGGQPDDLRSAKRKAGVAATLLRDSDRSAFAAYGVVVLPSVVVLDGKGRICSAVSGYPLAFRDLMADAFRYIRGKMTREQYEAALVATVGQPSDEEEDRQKAQRLSGLAYQLLRRGSAELALERYEEAARVDPSFVPVRVGLARCLIRLRRIDEARRHLEDALREDPKNVNANLALAHLELLQGDAGLAVARSRLERILILHPLSAEAHYLLGAVFEAQGEGEKAMAEYKEAAQLLLEVRLQGPSTSSQGPR